MAQESRTSIGTETPQPVFLEPHTYRRRRLMDGARILPVLGAILWMIPLFWPSGASQTEGPVSTSSAMLYIFAVWFGLILVAGGIWFKTRSGQPEDINALDADQDRYSGPD